MFLRVLEWLITKQVFGTIVIGWQVAWAMSLWAAALMIQHGGMLGVEYDARKLLLKGVIMFGYAVLNYIFLIL